MPDRHKAMERWKGIAAIVTGTTTLGFLLLNRREKSKLRGLACRLHPVGIALEEHRLKADSTDRELLAEFSPTAEKKAGSYTLYRFIDAPVTDDPDEPGIMIVVKAGRLRRAIASTRSGDHWYFDNLTKSEQQDLDKALADGTA